MTSQQEAVYFDATLTPNRSLQPVTLTILIVGVGCANFVAGLAFVSMGAFPVIGFFGLDFLAIWYAFRVNARYFRQATRIRITADHINLRHETHGKPALTVSAPTAFAQIDLAFPARRPSELILRYGGTAWRIGRFLTPSERVSLKQALSAAIQRARAERYNNHE